MKIRVPSPEEFAKSSARWPDLYFVEIDGEEVPIVLGNPRSDSVAWRDICAATFKVKTNVNEAVVVHDCLLYPLGDELEACLERWPALIETITPTLRDKIGWRKTALTEPDKKYKAPEQLAALLASNARAKLYTVAHAATPTAVVTVPPEGGAWRRFFDEVHKLDVDHTEVTREFALSVIAGVDGAASAQALFDRYPGLVLVTCLLAAGDAGMKATVRQGEWSARTSARDETRSS